MNTPSGFDYDISSNRHRGNRASVAAYESVRESLPEARQQVLAAVIHAGWRGLTAKEYAVMTGKYLHQVSGRFSELRFAGLVELTSERRDHCGVVVAVERQGGLF